MASVDLDINLKLDDTVKALKNLTKALEKSLSGVESDAKDAASSLKDVNKTAKDAGKSVGSFGDSLKNGAKLLAGFAAGFASLNLLKSSVENLTQFGDAVAEIGTIAGDSIKINDAFRSSLISTATEFGSDAASQAKSFYSIVSAGITDATDAQSALVAANQLAVGGLASTEQSIDILTSALNSFKGENLEAQQAADILFATVQSGKTTVSELSASFGQSFSSAATLGITFREAAAGLADLTTKGNNTAVATTKLKALFNSFVLVQSKLKDESVEVADAFDLNTIKQRGLQQTLQDIQAATGGSITKLQQLLGSTEAVSAFTSIASGEFENFNNILGKDTAGAAEDAADKIKNTLGFQLQQLKSNFGNLILTLTLGGEDESVSTLKSINELLKDAIENSDALAASIKLVGIAATTTFAVFKVKNAIIGIAGLTKAVAQSTLVMNGLRNATIAYNVAGGGIAGVTAVVKGLSTAIKSAALSTKGLKLAFKGLLAATGIGLIVIAVTELIELFLELKTEVGGFGNATKIVFESVKGTLAEIGKGIIGIFEDIPFIGDKFKDQFESAKATLQEIVDESAKTVADIKLKAELDKEGVGRSAKKAAETAEQVIADNPPVITPKIDEEKIAAEAEKAKKIFEQNLKLDDFLVELNSVGKSVKEIARIDIGKQVKAQVLQVNSLLEQGTIDQKTAAELRVKIAENANIKLLEIQKKESEQAQKLAQQLSDELKKNDDKLIADAKKRSDEELRAISEQDEARAQSIRNAVKFATDFGFIVKESFQQITGLGDKTVAALAELTNNALSNVADLGSSILGGVGGTQTSTEIDTTLQDQLAAINESVLAGELSVAQASEKRFEAERNAQEQLSKISENNLQTAGDSISGTVSSIFDSILPGIGGLAGSLLDVLSAPPDALAKQIEGFISAIPAFVSRIAENLPTIISSLAKGLITSLVDAIPQLISQLADIVPGLLIALVDAITDPAFIDSLIAAVFKFVTAIIDALPTIITALVNAIPTIIKAIARELPGIIVALVRAIPQIINALILAIPDIIVALVEAIPIIITGLIDALPELFPELINGAIEALPQIIGAFITLIPRIIVALARGIFGIFQSLGGAVTNIFKQGIGDAVSDFGNGIAESVKSFGSTLLEGASEFVTKFLEIPGQFITGLINDLKDGISKVFEGLNPFGGGGGGGGVGGITDSISLFAKGIDEVPPGFPKDNFLAGLTSGERVVPSNTNQDLKAFLANQNSGGSSRTDALLAEIATLLEQPMTVQTSAEVNGQTLADIILELSRNNARLTA